MERPTVTGRSSAIGSRSRGDRGYTLVAVIVAVTVLNVLLAVALPLWSQRIQRQKEEELIARGLQYAQAIQVFQTRFGRLPVRLEELIEVKPRSIRQLWKDPMTKDGKWGLIFQGANGATVTPPNPNDRGRQGGRSAPGTLAQGTSPGLERGRKGDRVTIGPISGVYSLSTEESILTFNDAKQHSEWKFDTQLLVSTVSVGSTQQAGAPPGAATVLPARWMFRKGITVQRQRPNQQIPPGSGPGRRP